MAASLYLRVSRGKTRHPLRPVDQERFLIGAGSHCHLRLAPGSPIVHSILMPCDEGWRIESLVAHPPLLVNGEETRQRQIEMGDRLTIGPYEFDVEPPVSAPQQIPLASTNTAIPEFDRDGGTEADLATYSAAELVGLIERENAEVERFEQACRRGARDLLRQVRGSRVAGVINTRRAPRDSDPPREAA